MPDPTIPAGWKTFVLGPSCSKIGSGATPRGGSSVYRDDGVALIRSQNVLNDGFSADGLAYIDDEHALQLQNVAVQAGDVLLNITGDSVARVCQAPRFVLPARVNQHVAIIRPRPEVLDPAFVRYHLVSGPVQHELLAMAGGGATRNALTKGMIERLEIVAPASVEDQRAVGSVLSALDDKTELNRRTSETLEAIARALFQSWFVDFDPVRAKVNGEPSEAICARLGLTLELLSLFPDAFVESQVGEVPSGWAVAPFPDVIEVNPVRTLRRGVRAPYLDMGGMPTTGARASGVIEREFGSGMKFVNGDTLLARITPCLENGKTCFVDFLNPGEVGWGSTEYIVLHPRLNLPATYGYFLARTDALRDHAVAAMTGSSGRQRVPASAFDNFGVVVPSAPVARAFGATADAAIAHIRALDKQSATLAAARDALLPRLLSGELRISDVERALAAA